MKQSTVFSILPIFTALTAAVPLQPRDVKHVVHMDVVTDVVNVVQTVMVDQQGKPLRTMAPVTPSGPVQTPSPPKVIPHHKAAPPPRKHRPEPIQPKPVQPKLVHPKPAPPAPSSSSTTPVAVNTPPPAPPTSTPAPAAPTSTPAPKPAPSPKPKPAPKPKSGGGSTGGSGAQHTGDLTYYNVAAGYGSCGVMSSPSEPVVAVAEDLMEPLDGDNPNDNPMCGKEITINWNGKSETAKIVDTCPGCAAGGLDLSTSLFQKFAPLSEGRLTGMTWSLS